MHSNFVKELQASEGKLVRLTSTEGEVLSARVLHVSEQDEDVTIDILATNQPERYERVGKNDKDSAWAIPFAFIAALAPSDQSDNPEMAS